MILFILKMVYYVYSLGSPLSGDSNENTQNTFIIWRKSHWSQMTLSAERISYNIARQVKLTPDAFCFLRHVRRILQVATCEKWSQARKKVEHYYTIMTCVNIN